MTATATAIRKIETLTIDGIKFHATPMDHGGWLITYSGNSENPLYLTATDKKWIGGEAIDWSTDEGEDEVRWTNLTAARRRIRELNRM